ncbi:unnamed protein product [Paramecium sonneborni]|uniref:Acyl-coenzyme A oxidase n=1 Tax=Paramecium sonneborni TaxID=65129 RepID=A0A8S1M794_9CILI|nr:unnamed protein product [Paramecium sonneborni]
MISLEQVRQQSKIDKMQVAGLIYGSQERAKEIQQFFLDCEKVPEVQTNADFYNWSRKKQFLSKDKQGFSFMKMINNKVDDMEQYTGPMIYSATTNHYGVYLGMVVPAVKILGTDEQIKAWLDDLINIRKAACYAQTELGHGSDIQSLQTTATYDKQREEFIINTPTIQAAKFWPGDLGILANWALVFAQLIVDDKNYGVQSFMVQIRDVETHKPLNGIEVGDIGPKIGYQVKDNGFLKFNNVRIPKFNMLAKYISITPQGNVIKQGDPKISYASMMMMRKLLNTVYPKAAAISLTIALRYSYTRQQFTNDSKIENSIIEYQTQQHKLLPLLANLFAVVLSGNMTSKFVDFNFNEVQNGNFQHMNACHSLLCGTKANYTHFVVNCAEWCRLSCGGHGYAHYSGLPSIYQEHCPNVTLEGENQIMFLQLARYLLKLLKTSQKNPQKIPEQFSLFKKIDQILQFKCDQFQFSNILSLLESSVIHLITQTGMKMMQEIQGGLNPKSAWDYKLGTSLWESANYFIEYYKFVCFQKTILQVTHLQTQVVLTNLLNLFGITILLQNPLTLLENDVVTQQTIKQMKDQYENLLTLIKPEALVLIESFCLADGGLRTTIGRADGKPYEYTYDWALNENSINQMELTSVVNQLKNCRPKL